MKKYGHYALALTLFLVGLFIGHRLQDVSNKNSEEFNPFLQSQQKAGSEQNSDIYALEGELVEIGQKAFKQEDLPIDIKYKIYREQSRYFENIRTILTEFSLRANYVLKNQIQLDHINELPSINEAYRHLVKDEEVMDIYNKNKEKLEGTIKETEALANIRYQLLSKRIIQAFQEDTQKLQHEKKLYLYNNAPPLPKKALPKEEFFRLGSKDGDIDLSFIGGYFCKECFDYDKQIAAFFRKFKNRISFSYYPHSHNLMQPDGIFSRSAFCLNEQDHNLFWKFHYKVTEDREYYLNEFSPSTPVEEVYSYIKEKIKELDYNKKSFNECFAENNAKTFQRIYKINRRLEMLDIAPAPAAVLNNRKLPLSTPHNLEQIIQQFSDTRK